ncbi:hypothetical protein [Candidatus Uabimicrobium sp. HlEnr_7]|uniref:hypothetical protein n=1 Tax=Candidatus Uabimicrobium helgolandensis TaxID=3095367 RepID=UPI00355891D1
MWKILIVFFVAILVLILHFSLRTVRLVHYESSRNIIMAIDYACEEYRAVFRVYPDVANLHGTMNENGYPGDKKVIDPVKTFSDSDFKEMNKRLYFMLTKDYEGDVFFQSSFLQTPATSNNNDDASLMFVDEWGRFLRVCPGRDHSGDIPRGENRLDEKHRWFEAVDVYSVGLDGKDGYSLKSTTATKCNKNEVDDIDNWTIRY